jgi:hypothetical protein
MPDKMWEQTDTKPMTKKDIGNVSMKTLKGLLSDSEFLKSENIRKIEANKVVGIMNVLEENNGKWPTGRKSLNGHCTVCPIHGYSPVTECVKCKWWKGDSVSGRCTNNESAEKYMKEEKISYTDAMDRERINRQNHVTEEKKER